MHMEHVPDHLLANICYMLPSMTGIASANRRFASIAQQMRTAYVTAMTARGNIIALRPELLAPTRRYK